MSSTSSEEKAEGLDSIQRDGFGTVNEAEEDVHQDHPAHDEGPDRKRRRTTAGGHEQETRRELRMQQYTKARIKDFETPRKNSKGEGRSRAHTPMSRERSQSRSEGRARSKSPGVGQILPARVGKRLRRRPQRWDGEKTEQPRALRGVSAQPSSKRESERASKDSDAEQTLSASSAQYEGECPVPENPSIQMKKELDNYYPEMNRRFIVDSFHTWQLQSVSRQAAQQKALQVFLKRKLRRRTGRAPEIERVEEDALRNARTVTVKTGLKDNNGERKETFAGLEDEAEDIVPSKLRLPLEAYLPRRVTTTKRPLSTEEILNMSRLKPHLSGPLSEITEANGDGHQAWMDFPTVTTTSSLNKQKRNYENGQGRGH